MLHSVGEEVVLWGRERGCVSKRSESETRRVETRERRTHGDVLPLQHDLPDVAQLLDERLDVLLPAPLRLEERLVGQLGEVLAVRVDELVEVALLLGDKVLELGPLACDDLEVAVVLDLAHEEDHLAQRDARLVEVVGERCCGTSMGASMLARCAATTPTEPEKERA